jgi:septal ring factor EnvC (AmiA/AmiB activator)
MDQNDVVCRNVSIVSACPATHAHHAEAPHPAPASKSRLAVLWGVSGTVLSTLGFIAWALFEQYNNNLMELQRDLKHFHEASADLVKKDSLQRCYNKLAECTRELQASTTAREQLVRELEASQKSHREMEREVQHLRERLASVEGRQSATPIVVTLPAEKR